MRVHLHQHCESQTGTHWNNIMNKKKTISAAKRRKALSQQ